MEKLLTTIEASQYLEQLGLPFAVASLNVYRCHGTGPKYIKAGRRIRYRPSDLDTWIKSRMEEKTSTA